MDRHIKSIKWIDFSKNFSEIWNENLKLINDKNIHDFDSQIESNLLDDEIELHSKKIWNIISESSVIDENTTTGNPFHLEAYFMDSWEFPVIEWLEKYRTVLLETLFWYKIKMSVIWESHCITIVDKNNEIIASEIVACLPLKDFEHMYKLEDKKSIKIKKKWYEHKIMKFTSEFLGNKLWTEFHHWKDIFYSVQQDLLKLWEPQCSYDFPFHIEQEHDWIIHKIKTAWITGIKAFSIENENKKKVIIYSLHWYKQKWWLVYWDAPTQDNIIITRSIFDLDILWKK